jgi:CheY-like chemotaxis protein
MLTVESLTPASPLEIADLRILVVDDEPDARRILTTILEEYGAKVTTVASAAEAIEVLKQLQPDVLISDIGMPEEDGYTLLRRVRNLDIEQGGQIPAVALTAYVRQEDYTHALAAGFQMHLSKPVDTTELIRAVAKLAGRTQNV